MCGRYILHSEKNARAVKAIVEEVNIRFNMELKKGDIYPSNLAPVFVGDIDKKGMQLGLMNWGYETHFGNKRLLINARSETVLEKKTFRQDFFERRCLIPAAGFYEWNDKKEKFLFSANEELLYMGGFFNQKVQAAFIILTKEPIETVAAVHNRMPVLIEKSQAGAWLSEPNEALKLMKKDQVFLNREVMTGQEQLTFI
ncbi:SOS response-associated peptidase family protein [Eubacteriaceae bacterium ES3]|nr:SOS response-associated peptidase family protein [Eubacteriaceae bacterium ES3]